MHTTAFNCENDDFSGPESGGSVPHTQRCDSEMKRSDADVTDVCPVSSRPAVCGAELKKATVGTFCFLMENREGVRQDFLPSDCEKTQTASRRKQKSSQFESAILNKKKTMQYLFKNLVGGFC